MLPLHLLQFCTEDTGLELKMFMFLYNKGWQTFAIKNHIENILGFMSHMVSVTTTHFCYSTAKVTKDNMKRMDVAVSH